MPSASSERSGLFISQKPCRLATTMHPKMMRVRIAGNARSECRMKGNAGAQMSGVIIFHFPPRIGSSQARMRWRLGSESAPAGPAAAAPFPLNPPGTWNGTVISKSGLDFGAGGDSSNAPEPLARRPEPAPSFALLLISCDGDDLATSPAISVRCRLEHTNSGSHPVCRAAHIQQTARKEGP